MRLSFLTTLLFVAANAAATELPCTLLPLQQQLQAPEVRRELPQYAESNYRNQLLRFTTNFYARLAQDLLRGEGEYLTSLHRLMGSSGNSCTHHYRGLLLSNGNSRDFALALWQLRQQKPTQDEPADAHTTVHAAAENGGVSQLE